MQKEQFLVLCMLFAIQVIVSTQLTLRQSRKMNKRKAIM